MIDDKFRNMMLAHLDGVCVFSAREDCDQLVRELIHLALDSVAHLRRAEAAERKLECQERAAKIQSAIQGWEITG